MSKAKQRALERFPVHEGASKEWIEMHLKGVCAEYIEGYRQAEKDLELTNADIYDIWRIYNEVCAEGKILGFDETSQEVLKRYKNLKK